jgi:adenylate cyclase
MLSWTTGYPEAALEQAAESIALAREVQHPYSLAFALALLGQQVRYRRDTERMVAVTEELLALTRDWGFVYWQAEATLMDAWIHASRGQVEQAFERAAESRSMFRSRGVEVQPYYLITEAEIAVAANRPEHALAVLDTAVSIDESRGEPVWWSSELYRLRGELLEDEAAAERDLQRAIQQSQRMGTRSLELRAALALARRMHRRGETAEALAILEPRLEAMSDARSEPDTLSAAAFMNELAAASQISTINPSHATSQ